MIPATPEPKIPEDGPEPEFRPEFFRNFEPSKDLRGFNPATVKFDGPEVV
jgi:hypothetical protein